MPEPQPPIAVVLAFIACINRGDVPGLAALMRDDHQLQVLDESPLIGKAANIEAWHGYCHSFPDYVISPHRIVEHSGRVAVLGHTTGSHLGLSDEQESALTVIWIAEVIDGLLGSWKIVEDTTSQRTELGLEWSN
jgi:ketosteroid isomerase-like protein